MKLVSLVVALAGVAALLLGAIVRALNTPILDIRPTSFLGVAATLFLLALVVIEYDRTYGTKRA